MQVKANGGAGALSWAKGTRDLLSRRQLAEFWVDTKKCCRDFSARDWKDLVYKRVEEASDASRHRRMCVMSSAANYRVIKHWGTVDAQHASFRGEEGKKGALVCESYLDDMRERLGSHLKMLCRMRTLPTLTRVTREAGVSQCYASCLMCESGELEDIVHVLLHCESYVAHRERMFRIVKAGCEWFDAVEDTSKVCVLLGQRIGSKSAEDNIDHAVKRFLKKAWRVRRHLTASINAEFERNDVVGDKWKV